MKALILIPLIALTACSASKPPYVLAPTPPGPPQTIYSLRNYQGPEAMEGHEVRQAQRLCIMSKMQPVTHYITVKTDVGSRVQVPVGVVCEPF